MRAAEAAPLSRDTVMRIWFEPDLRLALLICAGVGAAPVRAAEVCVLCQGPAAQYRCAFAGDTGPSPDPRLAFACLNELSKSGGHRLCAIARNSTGPCEGALKTLARPETEAPAYVEVPVKGAATHGAFNDKGEAEVTPDQFKAGAAAATPEGVPDTSPETAPGNAPGHKPQKQKVEKPESAGEAQGKDAPPKTVKDLVDQSAGTTGKSIATAGETAGKAAGDAAQSAGNAVSKAGSAVTNAAKKTWTCLTSLFGDCKFSSN